MQESIFFIGGVFTEKTLLENLAVSPATNRWLKGLFSAIKDKRIRIKTFAHLPEPLWPKGILLPGKINCLDSNYDSNLIRYVNLPFLRSRSLSYLYLFNFIKSLKRSTKPFAILSYYPSFYASIVGNYAQNKYKIPWIDICPDVFDPGPNGHPYPRGASNAKGHVFLSYKAYKNSLFQNNLHLDGGIESIKFSKKNRIKRGKIILYTGMLDKWGGIKILLKAFKKIKDPSVRLWVCGHGESKDLNLALKKDSRITYYGLVPEKKLEQLCNDTTVFVNPRPNSVLGNDMNFPSKVLEYLSYGKPVISTWTPGLSPDYKSVLDIIEKDSAEHLSHKILSILSWPETKFQKKSVKIKQFMQEKKTWDYQASRLIDWIKTNIVF